MSKLRSPLLVPSALGRVTQGAGALHGATSTALWTTPDQPCSETGPILPAKKGIWKDLLYLSDRLLHTSSFRVPHTIFISSASVEFHHRFTCDEPWHLGEVTHQPRPGTILTETGGYTLGEGDRRDFNIKHYQNKKKLPFSQEHVQTLLCWDKAPKPAR